MSRHTIKQNTLRWAAALLTALAVLTLPATATASQRAEGPTSLSRWLSKQIVPELREQFASHPLFEQAQIRISSASPDALAEAIATVLTGNLQGTPGIALSQPAERNSRGHYRSIDELGCSNIVAADYQLLVSVFPADGRRARVSLQLVEPSNTAAARSVWQWQGKLSSDEEAYSQRDGANYDGRGQLEAPWTHLEFELAANQLSRDFACALRPAVARHTTLHWNIGDTSVPPFSDTIHASRALLGQIAELSVVEGAAKGVVESGADYDIRSRVQRLSGDIWQLWLTGHPISAGGDPVQAVTYFTAPGLNMAPATQAASKTASARHTQATPNGDPLDYMQVELLDTLQTDTGRRSASLEVSVRLSNRAEWPIEYSFSLSGGHFNHCIARAGYYRHDQYGTIKGSIDPGENRVQRLTIEQAVHRPTPLFGMRQCAGFRDIDGFEDFASQGYKVTDFVRWAQ